ncbi:hypothetical protein MM239_03265 [Belliella sp. DSM 111904]|uniref:Uncharacterized protein n=1 Tax=Belliella filtrata TaxID=2923435 RepID=A0ABS9UWH5_9BACT|nr:hypothetical protein [Belliella filtrata]MCH7408403.1 hypothetical protein [Belliella filtrata]
MKFGKFNLVLRVFALLTLAFCNSITLQAIEINHGFEGNMFDTIIDEHRFVNSESKTELRENEDSFIQNEALDSLQLGIIFRDDFSNEELGAMPKLWKSSGGGAVVNEKGENWLELKANVTYRIDSLIDLPEDFEVSFDLLTKSDQARDIGAMRFGFGRDNSVRRYIMDAYNNNAITSTQIHFSNKKVTSSSSDTKLYTTDNFPLNSYANRLMKVRIQVKGENMIIFIDDEKLLDAAMFNKNSVKFFYLSAPFNYKNDARMYFKNFKIVAID